MLGPVGFPIELYQTFVFSVLIKNANLVQTFSEKNKRREYFSNHCVMPILPTYQSQRHYKKTTDQYTSET